MKVIPTLAAICLLTCAVQPRAGEPRESTIFSAVEKGMVNRLEEALRRDRNSVRETLEDTGETPLHLAVRSNTLPATTQLAIIQKLIQAGADLNAPNILGETPVDYALLRPDVEEKRSDRNGTQPCSMLTLLKRFSADLDDIGLSAAAALGDADRVCALLRNESTTLEQKYRALDCAAVHNRIAIVEILLRNGLSPDGNRRDGVTPLHFAARRGQAELARALANAGADINQRDRTDRRTPLMEAIRFLRFDLARMLVEKGARLNLEDGKGLRLSDYLEAAYLAIPRKGPITQTHPAKPSERERYLRAYRKLQAAIREAAAPVPRPAE